MHPLHFWISSAGSTSFLQLEASVPRTWIICTARWITFQCPERNCLDISGSVIVSSWLVEKKMTQKKAIFSIPDTNLTSTSTYVWFMKFMKEHALWQWWNNWYWTSPPTANRYKTGEKSEWKNSFQTLNNKQPYTMILERIQSGAVRALGIKEADVELRSNEVITGTQHELLSWSHFLPGGTFQPLVQEDGL